MASNKHSLSFTADVKVILHNLEAFKVEDGDELGMSATEAMKMIADELKKKGQLEELITSQSVEISETGIHVSADLYDVEISPTGKSREDEISEMAKAAGQD